jgi:hypothetical protein
MIIEACLSKLRGGSQHQEKATQAAWLDACPGVRRPV